MEKNPYYNHPHSLPPQIPPLPPYGHIPQQLTLPHLQSQEPHQQSTVYHHHPQVQLLPVQVELQDNYNSPNTVPASVSTPEFINTNATSPPPFRQTTNVNENPPESNPFDLPSAPQQGIPPPTQYQSQSHYDDDYQSLAASYNDLQNEKDLLSNVNRLLTTEVGNLETKLTKEKANNLKVQTEPTDQINSLKSELLSARFKNKQVAKTVAKLEEKNRKLEEKNRKLEEKLKSVENKQKGLVEQKCIDEDNEKLSKEIATLEIGNNNLSNQVKKLIQEAKQKENGKQLLIAKHDKEMSKLNEKLNKAKNQIQNLSENIKKVQNELEEQKKTFSSKAKQPKKELDGKRELETKLQKYQYDNILEISRLERDLKEEKAKCARKSNIIATLRKPSNSQVQSKSIKPVVNQVESLKSDKDHLRRQLDGTLTENKKLSAKIEYLNVQINELLESNEKLSQIVIQDSITIQTLEKKIETNLALGKKPADKVQDDSSQQKICELAKEVEEQAKYFKELEKKINIERKLAAFYSSKLKNSDKVNAQLLSEVNAEKAKMQKAQEKVQEYEEWIEVLSKKVDDLKEDVEEANEEINKLKDKITSFKEKVIEAGKQEENSEICIIELCSQLQRMKGELKQAKLKPFPSTPRNNVINISNPLEEVSEDEFPVLSSGINPTREKKKQTPNHDDADHSFQPSRKRVRWNADLNNLNVTEKMHGYKNSKSN
ncbi:unnamed protein product [Orchesella dallaii]|uniref:Uncharacterized protein n=1 Tax=Orchesella dallaii TaxID=48710 RepID=A0ABP1RHZ0_9HEXA